MRVHICAVGRLRAGPERTLIDDYLQRFDRTGRALGLGPIDVREVEDRKVAIRRLGEKQQSFVGLGEAIAAFADEGLAPDLKRKAG